MLVPPEVEMEKTWVAKPTARISVKKKKHLGLVFNLETVHIVPEPWWTLTMSC